jgi:hypothetical protein
MLHVLYRMEDINAYGKIRWSKPPISTIAVYYRCTPTVMSSTCKDGFLIFILKSLRPAHRCHQNSDGESYLTLSVL